MGTPAVDSKDLLAKLHDQHWVNAFKSCQKHEHRVALLRNYNSQDQGEEAVIQWFINHLDPPRPSVNLEGQVRLEMGDEEAKGWKDPSHKTDTPEGEAYWEEKLEAARKEDKRLIRDTLVDSYKEIRKALPDVAFPDIGEDKPVVEDPGEKPAAVVKTPGSGGLRGTPKKEGEAAIEAPKESTKLKDLPGFSDNTVEKFNKAGIMDTDKLFKLSYKEALVIAKTALVLRNIKDKFKAE